MVREHFAPVPFIDEERIAAAIELTRFPVPENEDHAATDTEAALVRAADLIGQLGDPLYPRKLNALYHEFVETGMHERLGYAGPADMVDRYPQFYWSKIERYIGDALRYLEMTMEGKQWTATLYSHIFAIEHNRRRMGAGPGPPDSRNEGRSCWERIPKRWGGGASAREGGGGEQRLPVGAVVRTAPVRGTIGE